MLAVTEVNNCDICSYAHAKMALEAGMSSEEIQNMLSGVIDDAPLDETHGVLFGQHYADTRGNPEPDTWIQLNSVYSKDKALGILAATRVIMLGNASGIPLSSFSKRIKGKNDDRLSLGYELMIILGSFFVFTIAGIHALAAGLIGIPYAKFTGKTGGKDISLKS